MSVPSDRRYTATHQWVKREADGRLTVGITDYAQQQLGDVVYVELPAPGRHVTGGEACAVVESVKSASGIPAPVSGEILEHNAAAAASPAQLNEAPYEAWLFRMRPAEPEAFEALLDAAAYAAHSSER